MSDRLHDTAFLVGFVTGALQSHDDGFRDAKETVEHLKKKFSEDDTSSYDSGGGRDS